MSDFFRKYKWWFILIFIVPLAVSYFVFAFNGFIPAGEVGKDTWLSFWGGFLAFYGTVFLGIVAVWQTGRASQQTDAANDLTRRLLSIEEQSRTPFLEIRREACEVKKEADNAIRILLCAHNISILPVHNIKLVLGVQSDNIALSDYNEKNFYAWMVKIAKATDVRGQSENIDFVASLSESSVRKRTTHKNGQREEHILGEYSDMMTFNITCPFTEDVDYSVPVKFFMQNVNGQLYKQSTTLYIRKKSNGNFHVFNHSTKVELLEHKGTEEMEEV